MKPHHHKRPSTGEEESANHVSSLVRRLIFHRPATTLKMKDVHNKKRKASLISHLSVACQKIKVLPLKFHAAVSLTMCRNFAH